MVGPENGIVFLSEPKTKRMSAPSTVSVINSYLRLPDASCLPGKRPV
jgi:hypothetical protein